jgi:hypothetical protein
MSLDPALAGPIRKFSWTDIYENLKILNEMFNIPSMVLF